MPKPPDESCAACAYWVERPGRPGIKVGECRCEPPSCGRDGIGRWPRTDADGWCGEYWPQEAEKELEERLGA